MRSTPHLGPVSTTRPPQSKSGPMQVSRSDQGPESGGMTTQPKKPRTESPAEAYATANGSGTGTGIASGSSAIRRGVNVVNPKGANPHSVGLGLRKGNVNDNVNGNVNGNINGNASPNDNGNPMSNVAIPSSKREKAKPIFEWFTRKLGGHRRATLSDASQNIPKRPDPSTVNPTHYHRREVSSPPTTNLSRFTRPTPKPGPAVEMFSFPADTGRHPESERDNSLMTRSESHSLRSYRYSLAGTVERETRREANNPYPFIPIPRRQGVSTESESQSQLHSRAPSTRHHESPPASRTPSIRSEVSLASSLRRRSPTEESGSGMIGPRHLNLYADEDASLRPIPPSHHSSSPTQSISIPGSDSIRAFTQPSFRTSTGSAIGGGEPWFLSSEQHDVDVESQSGSLSGSGGFGSGSRRPTSSVSTKPTTVLSIDSGPRPAHIAQVQVHNPNQTQISAPLPSSPLRSNDSPPRVHDTTNGANDVGVGISRSGGMTAAQAMVIQSSNPLTNQVDNEATPLSNPIILSESPTLPVFHSKAPKWSQLHPRDNPVPLAVPAPNASMLTLASSTFGLPNVGNNYAGSIGGYSTSGTIGQQSITRLRDLPSTSHSYSQSQPQSQSAGILPPQPQTTRSNAPSILWGVTPTSPSTSMQGGPNSISERERDRPLSIYSSYHRPASLRTNFPIANGSSSIHTHAGNGNYLLDDDASINASTKAVRGRRESWESGESRWSWRGVKLGYNDGASAIGASAGPGAVGHRSSFQSSHPPRKDGGGGAGGEERRKSDGQSLRFDLAQEGLSDGVEVDGVEVDGVEVDGVEVDGVEVDGVEVDDGLDHSDVSDDHPVAHVH